MSTKVFLRLKLTVLPKSKYSRLFPITLVLFSFSVGIIAGYYIPRDAPAPVYERAIVAFVIDGDTIELEDGRRIRYLGIDTPESDESYYSEATEKNIELVEGKLVRLQQGNRDMDEYGRFLRYVYADGVFVNAELVAQGYAKAYIFDPNERYAQILVQLEQYAKLRHMGLWKR
ncbi:thermonuclease family protein [Chloroflexota bacterium]